MSKGKPVPTRFDRSENEAIETLHRRTGLSRAEIVRRAVRLLRRRYEDGGSAAFIIEELSPHYRSSRTTDEGSTGYGPKKKAQK